jgi:hypothetical protein
MTHALIKHPLCGIYKVCASGLVHIHPVLCVIYLRYSSVLGMRLFSKSKVERPLMPRVEDLEYDFEHSTESAYDIDRKRPVIEVLSAKPMSEVGFRDAKPSAAPERKSLPPPPKRPGKKNQKKYI